MSCKGCSPSGQSLVCTQPQCLKAAVSVDILRPEVVWRHGTKSAVLGASWQITCLERGSTAH